MKELWREETNDNRTIGIQTEIARNPKLCKTTFAHLPSNEPRFIIDANSREINIPFEFSFLGVIGDHKAETIYFEIDRYFDDEDLSTHTCVIQFVNKNPKTLECN